MGIEGAGGRGREATGGCADLPWPSSLKVNSRFSLSFSFFPLLRFLPPCCEILGQHM